MCAKSGILKEAGRLPLGTVWAGEQNAAQTRVARGADAMGA
jgi:hypothetical protein